VPYQLHCCPPFDPDELEELEEELLLDEEELDEELELEDELDEELEDELLLEDEELEPLPLAENAERDGVADPFPQKPKLTALLAAIFWFHDSGVTTLELLFAFHRLLIWVPPRLRVTDQLVTVELPELAISTWAQYPLPQEFCTFSVASALPEVSAEAKSGDASNEAASASSEASFLESLIM